MDQFFEQLFRRETIYLVFIVIIGTFFIRRIVETAMPSIKGHINGQLGETYKTKLGLWWNSVILYALPVVLGALIALIAFKEIVPDNISTRPGAAAWGAIIGWCSSFIYKVVRKFLKKKTGVDLTPGPANPLDEAPDSGKDEEDKPAKKKRQPTKKDEDEAEEPEAEEAEKDDTTKDE